MKVKDLIAKSVLTPGAGRQSETAPRVTIILPTFRRGDSGLLKNSIDSLLAQSFADFELIIVDDASTDSSATVIAEAMARDDRISLIRHEGNIGLPAISEYEAYAISRGQLIAFAFDDTIWYPTALGLLVGESDLHPNTLVAAKVFWFSRSLVDGSTDQHLLGAGATEADLLSRNIIPNNAVLVPKTILETVGLYDPHVSLARLCDYDLWLRIRRQFAIHFVEECIGEEHGPSTTDSLGNTYPVEDWTCDDRMRQRRNHLLKPKNFAELDVFEAVFESARSRRSLSALVDHHLATRPWMSAPAPPSVPGAFVPRVLVLASELTATSEIVFEGLRDAHDVHVRVLDPDIRSVSHLADVDLLIVMRDFDRLGDWIALARSMGMRVLCYLDDNLPLMAAHGELADDLRQQYLPEALRPRLKYLNGILAGTERLAASLREQGMHPSVAALRLSAPSAIAEWREALSHRSQSQPPSFALFAGPLPAADIGQIVVPALIEALQKTGEGARLIVPGSIADELREEWGSEALEIVALAESKDYFVELRTLRDLGVDTLIVPPTSTVNAEFGSLHPLLAAAALGATLVVPTGAPFDELGAVAGVTKIDTPASVEEWAEALGVSITRSAASSRSEWGVPAELLSERFDPEDAKTVLLEAISPFLTPVEPNEPVRIRLIADWLSARHAHIVTGDATQLGQVAPQSPTLVAQLQETLRGARRLHVFRGGKRPVPGLQHLGPDGERFELSRPINGVPYISYWLPLAPGSYRTVSALLWADGEPADFIGIEVVSPAGKIILHTVTRLPRHDQPVTVTFDSRSMPVADGGIHEVRIFAQTKRLAFVLEKVDRGPLGLRRPRVSPQITFEL